MQETKINKQVLQQEFQFHRQDVSFRDAITKEVACSRKSKESIPSLLSVARTGKAGSKTCGNTYFPFSRGSSKRLRFRGLELFKDG